MFVSTKKKDEHLCFWKLKWVWYQVLIGYKYKSIDFVVEKVFRSFESIELFFLNFGEIEMRKSWRMLRNDEKKEINGFYLKMIWQNVKQIVCFNKKKRWAFKFLKIEMSLIPCFDMFVNENINGLCFWKAFLFIWIYWAFFFLNFGEIENEKKLKDVKK